MSTSAQPPNPPAPPRTGSHVLVIVLLILLMMVAASVAAIWFGVELLKQNVHVQVTQQAGNRKQVDIKTPVGNFEVRKGEETTEAQLNLPFYPGATRVKDQDNGGVGLSFNFPDQNDVRIFIAKFQTSDPLDTVRDFYGSRIGDDVTQYTIKDKEGKTLLKVDRLNESKFKLASDKNAGKDEGEITFEMKHEDQERVVSLKSRDGGTQITLVHVLHTKAEAN